MSKCFITTILSIFTIASIGLAQADTINTNAGIIDILQDSSNVSKKEKANPKTDSTALVKTANENYVDNLDKALEPTIAATLAGLALAALALLIPLVSAQDERVLQRERNRDPVELINKEKNKLQSIKRALQSIKFSFYCFVGFLIEGLTFDIWEERHDLMKAINSSREMVDVGISGGLLALGLVLITIGATKLGDAIE